MSYMELFYPSSEQSSYMGADYISSGPDRSYGHRHHSSYGRSYPLMQPAVSLHVSMCCDKCIQKVRKALRNVDDVESVDIDMRRQKVIVRGDVDPERVLRKVRKAKKSATYWDSSNDYSFYGSGGYDSRGPYSSAYDDGYYTPSSTYDYAPSVTYDYNPTYDYNYNYPSSNSSNDYYGHNSLHHGHHSSYDAFRYR